MSLGLQRNKKIESHKIIKETVPLLSELYIELPKPNSNRKISLVNHHQYYVQNDYLTAQHNHNQQIKYTPRYSQQIHNHQAKERIFSLQKTNCSLANPNYQSQKQIICDWVRKMFSKKKLLGPHWQQKLKGKRKNILKMAFDCLKEQHQGIQSIYLHTQSKHKPHTKKQNHMVTMGLQRLQEILKKAIIKQERSVFSKILRFLAFQHSSVRQRSKFMNLNFSQQQSSSHPIFLRQTKNVPQIVVNSNLNKQIHRQSPKPIYWDNLQTNHHIKHVQSAKNIPIIANQYSLAPPPIVIKQPNLKKAKKENNLLLTQSVMSRQSDKNMINRQLCNSKSQPHQFAIGGIGGNFKYQFNQHNYIVVQPEQYPFKHNQQHLFTSPPSPLAHQFTNINVHKESLRNGLFTSPVGFTPLIRQSHDTRNLIRPHSHNQFASPLTQDKKLHAHQEIIQNRKSRSNSLSANIKIHFTNKEELKIRQGNQKVSDYQTDQKQAIQTLPRLGTAQSKRLRQNYQTNSYGNQLIPQDYIQTPKSPNYIYSTPISPMPKDSYKNIHVNYVNVNPPSTPSTPSNTHSSKNIVYQSLMAMRQQQKPQTKQLIRPANPDQQKKRNNGEKLSITKQTRLK